MKSGDFQKIRGVKGIAAYFDCDAEMLSSLLSVADQSTLYKAIRIPKKNLKRRGEFRIVYKAHRGLSQLQKNVATSIARTILLPDYVQGFIRKRSTVSNAKHHIGRALLLNADITDFFDSITTSQIIMVFEGLGCDPSTAEILARLCTMNGVLAQGLHTSPILSNLAVQALDQELVELCSKHRAIYTRYSDDIAISSDSTLPSLDDIRDILASHGFNLNPSKCRISKRGQPQYVTGLSVFDTQQPRIPRRLKRRLRLQLHYIKKYGFENCASKLGLDPFHAIGWYKWLLGHIDYVNAVEPELAAKYYDGFPKHYGKQLD